MIVGAGFGGLAVARGLLGEPVSVVLMRQLLLVEMADRLLTPFSEQSSRRMLDRRGAEVRVGVGVECIEPTTDGSVIAAHTTVWATGVTAEGLAAATGSPTASTSSSTGRGTT